MEKPITGLPGYPIAEYLLVLHPHEDLFNKIMKVKQEFATTFNCPSASVSKPHITLLKYVQYEMVEPRILKHMRTIAQQFKPFKVELNNFNGFPAHTIYMNVTTKNSIVEVVRGLRDVQKLLKFDDDHKPHFITTPHVTVARKLQPWQYEKGLQEFSNRHFSGGFMVNDLWLLKRRMANNSYYQTVEKIPLSGIPLPVSASTQGQLFA